MKLNSIQALRFLAAMLVVIMHATQGISENIHQAGHHTYWNKGSAGVHIFFVISGFVMYLTAPRSTGWSSAVAFFKKRLIRVVPPYWFYTSLKVALLLIVTRQGGEAIGLDAESIVKSLAFIPHKDASGNYFPILQVGWTLNYEMLFYLIFSLSLILSRLPFLIVTPALLCIFLYGRLEPNAAPLDFYSRGIIFEFLLGMLTGSLYKGNLVPNTKISGLLAVASLSAILLLPDYPGIDSLLTTGVASFFLVLSFLGLQKNNAFERFCSMMAPAGDASYSLYLVHPFVIAILSRLLSKTELPDSISLAILCLGSFFAAIASYHGLEKQISRILRPRSEPEKKLNLEDEGRSLPKRM